MNRTRNLSLLLAGVFASLSCWTTATAVAQTNSITGRVIFQGDKSKYKRKRIKTNKDPNCAKAKAKIGTEDVIINKGDTPTLRNVIVSIKSGLGDKVFSTTKEDVLLTQLGCQYKPHVIAMAEGQALRVLNGDTTNHNIHFLPKVNTEQNFTQPKKDLVKGRTLKLKAEDVFKVKCDVHPWMGCYIAVFTHPFFDVTGKDGTFSLKGMPDGKYVIEAWHEKFGVVSADVTVAGGAATTDLTFVAP